MLKVIGIGNLLRGDDSIGPFIIEKMSKQKLPVHIKLYDAGSDAFTILEHFLEKDPIILIDCAKMGENPGKYVKFNLDDSNIGWTAEAVSLHGFGFGEVYQMAKSMGAQPDCTIIGIEPKQMEFGSGMSDEVKKSIPSIINMVFEEATEYAE